MVVAAAAVVVVVQRGSDEPQGLTATSNGADPPSALFGDVEQLTPVGLPEGWDRCSGGPSTYEGAGRDWWAQTFGPEVDGRCASRVTVTQMPPDDQVEFPMNAEEGKLDSFDVHRWTDADGDHRLLFAWAVDQNLLVEACCGESGRRIDQLTRASLEGIRQRAPARCTGTESDLDREDLNTNLFGKRKRLSDREGCPIRTDVARMEMLPTDDHCFPGLGMVTIGTPFGASMKVSAARLYIRDPEGRTGPNFLAASLDLDADLPPSATDTGYTRDGRTIWIDEADDTRIYVVDDGGVEAWPRRTEGLTCA